MAKDNSVKELKETINKLKESEEKYRALVENTTDFIYMINKEDKILSLNKSAARLFGKKNKEIIGESIFNLFPKEIANHFSKSLKGVFKTGKSQISETKMIVSKKELWISANLNPVKDYTGKIIAVMGITRDITERKKAEEELKKSIGDWQTTFDSTSDLVMLLDKDFNIIRANLSTSKFLHLPINKIIGKRCYNLFHNTNKPLDVCPLLRARQTKKHEKTELYLPEKDVWIVATVDPILNNKGEINGAVHIIRDITQEKKVEEEIQNLAKFPSENPNPVYRIDKKGIILYANKTGSLLLKKQNMKIGGSADSKFKRLIQESFKSNKIRIIEDKIGNNIYSCTIFPIKEAGYLNVYCIDITEQKKSEEELKKAKETAETYLNIADVMLIAINADGKVTLINRKGCEILGYKEEEIIGKDWFNNFLPKRLRKITKAYSKKLLSGKIKPVEYHENPILNKNGEERLIAWHNILLRDEKGKSIGHFSSGEDITERKKTEEALKINEEKYRSLFRNMTDGFAYCKMIFDKNNNPVDFIYLEINDAFERLTGLKKKKILNKKVSETIPGIKSAHPELFKIYGNAALTGKSTRFEIYFKPLKIWLDITVYCPKKGYFVAVFENITEKKETEKELKESERKIKSILDSSPAVVFVKDLTGKYIFINKLYEKLFHISEKKIIGKTDYDIFPKEAADKFRGADLKVLKANKAIDIEEKVPQDDGIHYYISSKFPLYDLKGNAYAVCGIATDITNRKKAEEEIKESERKYRTLLENIPQKIFFKDRNSVYITCNDNYARDLRIKPEEIAGKTDFNFFPKKLAEKYRADDKKVITSGIKEDIIEEYIPDGGKLFAHTIKTPVKDEKGNIIGILGIFWDVTKEKRAEEEIKYLKEYNENILESDPNPIMVIKGDKIEYINKSFISTFGKTKKDYISKTLIKAMPSDTIHIFEEMLQDHNKPKEFSIKGKNFNVSSFIVTKAEEEEEEEEEEERKGIIIQDITDIKKVEEELKKKLEELEKFHKLTIGRELQMIELKKRIKELEGKLRNEQ